MNTISWLMQVNKRTPFRDEIDFVFRNSKFTRKWNITHYSIMYENC